MSKALGILISLVLLVTTGCSYGDPIARSMVVLDFPISPQQTNATLSVSNPQIQDAMRLIDQAFTTNGFVRDKTVAPEDQAQGIIAGYGAYDVLISGRQLIVNFVEFGKRRPSPIVVKTCDLLKEKLANRYGAKRVRIEVEAAGMETK